MEQEAEKTRRKRPRAVLARLCSAKEKVVATSIRQPRVKVKRRDRTRTRKGTARFPLRPISAMRNSRVEVFWGSPVTSSTCSGMIVEMVARAKDSSAKSRAKEWAPG